MPCGKCNRRLSHAPKVTGTKCTFLNEDELARAASRGRWGASSAWHGSQPSRCPQAGAEGFRVPPASCPGGGEHEGRFTELREG